MSVQLVVDMNLSVEWVAELAKHGRSAVHWSTVGNPRAEDSVIMAWTLANGHVVFTHDLDFGTMLALTHAIGPSVLQVRGQNVLPEDIGPMGYVTTKPHWRQGRWLSSMCRNPASECCRCRNLGRILREMHSNERGAKFLRG